LHHVEEATKFKYLQEANNSANARASGKLRNYRLVLTWNGRWKEYSVLVV